MNTDLRTQKEQNTGASALLSSGCHDAQCGIAEDNHGVRVETLAGELGPDVAIHFCQCRCPNVDTDAVTCSHGAGKLRGHGPKRLGMLSKLLETAGT